MKLAEFLAGYLREHEIYDAGTDDLESDIQTGIEAFVKTEHANSVDVWKKCECGGQFKAEKFR